MPVRGVPDPTTAQRIANGVEHLRSIPRAKINVVDYPAKDHPTDPQLRSDAMGVPPPTGLYVVLWSAWQSTSAFKVKKKASWVKEPRRTEPRQSRAYLVTTMAVDPEGVPSTGGGEQALPQIGSAAGGAGGELAVQGRDTDKGDGKEERLLAVSSSEPPTTSVELAKHETT